MSVPGPFLITLGRFAIDSFSQTSQTSRSALPIRKIASRCVGVRSLSQIRCKHEHTDGREGRKSINLKGFSPRFLICTILHIGKRVERTPLKSQKIQKFCWGAMCEDFSVPSCRNFRLLRLCVCVGLVQVFCAFAVVQGLNERFPLRSIFPSILFLLLWQRLRSFCCVVIFASCRNFSFLFSFGVLTSVLLCTKIGVKKTSDRSTWC